MSEIKLKVGQKVRLRSGKTGKVVGFKEMNPFDLQPFKAYIYEDEKEWYYTENGGWHDDGKAHKDDIVEILEEPEDEEAKENKLKRFHLKLYVRDSKGVLAQECYFSDSLVDIARLITSKLGIITDYDDKEGKGYANTLAHYLNNAGDIFCVRKEITQLNLHIATLEFKVTRRED